jgi:hypothetical protein
MILSFLAWVGKPSASILPRLHIAQTLRPM